MTAHTEIQQPNNQPSHPIAGVEVSGEEQGIIEKIEKLDAYLEYKDFIEREFYKEDSFITVAEYSHLNQPATFNGLRSRNSGKELTLDAIWDFLVHEPSPPGSALFKVVPPPAPKVSEKEEKPDYGTPGQLGILSIRYNEAVESLEAVKSKVRKVEDSDSYYNRRKKFEYTDKFKAALEKAHERLEEIKTLERDLLRKANFWSYFPRGKSSYYFPLPDGTTLHEHDILWALQDDLEGFVTKYKNIDTPSTPIRLSKDVLRGIGALSSTFSAVAAWGFITLPFNSSIDTSLENATGFLAVAVVSPGCFFAANRLVNTQYRLRLKNMTRDIEAGMKRNNSSMKRQEISSLKDRVEKQVEAADDEIRNSYAYMR